MDFSNFFIGDNLRLELVITRNNLGEEIKLYSSEKNSLQECAKEILNTFYEIKKKRRTKKIERMVGELENLIDLAK